MWGKGVPKKPLSYDLLDMTRGDSRPFAISFHGVAKRIEGREANAARNLGELARCYDPSEIYATRLEDSQLLCQTLQGCRETMECNLASLARTELNLATADLDTAEQCARYIGNQKVRQMDETYNRRRRLQN